jgi:PKHD-type hydroxylase
MKKLNTEKFYNASWNLYLDNIHTFAFWKNLFSKEECEKIISIAKNKKIIKGITRGGASKVRDSNITWLYACDDMEWVFRRVSEVVLNLNEKYFKFDLFGINEGFQFTNYKAPSGKYGKHVDRGFNIPTRKISISIQLTDPKEYKGGELYLYDSEEGILMDKEQGTLIMFPSYTLHEVKPVTKGERNSLVSWITGNSFK